MNRVTFAVFALWGIVLVGCEGNTDYQFYLQNESTEPVVVTHRLNGHFMASGEDRVVVAGGEVHHLGTHSALGGRSDVLDDLTLTSLFADTLQVTTLDGDSCTKDWRQAGSWRLTAEELQKVPASWEHTCTFSVGNDDF